MRKLDKFIISGLILFQLGGNILLTPLYAQTPSIKFDHINIDEGLSQSTVHSILQDSKGYLWFGTQDGLNKYDGYTFTIYKHDPFDSTTISDNYVRCLYEDKSGTLWIGTENGGLNRFNRKKETFVSYRHDPADTNSLSNNRIWAISEEKNGRLWIGTWGDGLELFDIKNNRFIHISHSSGNQLNDDHIRCLYKDQNNILWIGTEKGGLSQYNSKTKSFENFLSIGNTQTTPDQNRIQYIWEDSYNNLWIGANIGLNLFDRRIKKLINFPLLLDGKLTEVTAITEDDSGILLIGASGKGMFRFDPKTTSYQYIQHDSNNSSGLSLSGILVLYRDNANLIWVGTNGSGLARFTLTPKFKNYTHISTDSNSLSSTIIRAIYESRDSVLWVGSYGGLDKFDRKAYKSTHYGFDPENPHGLQNTNVYSIVGDIDGMLWVGTEGGGLYHFNPELEIFTHYGDNNHPSNLPGDFIFELLLDKNGNLWIGSEEGLSQLSYENMKNGHFVNYSSLLGEITVNSIIIDQDGFLWLGTEVSGLIRFDNHSETFVRYTHDPQNTNTISNNRIKCIYQDQSGIIWIGTSSGGLNKFDHNSQIFKYYTVKDGLPNDVVYGILEDAKKNLWLSTNNGISKFNPEKETFRNFDIRDGLQNNEFNTGAYYKSWTGEMFFGGIGGLNAFFPEKVQNDSIAPEIVLTDLTIFSKSVPIGETLESGTILHSHITETDELILSYKDRDFTFIFSALSFTAPEKNKYAYKMEGYDPNWIYTDASKRFATYTHLPAGNYTFKVKGTNHDGIWNKTGISLPIKIIPPFWKTWWAYSFYVLALLGLFFTTIQLRLKQIKKQKALLERQVLERTVEIQHNQKEIERQNQFLNSVIESLSQPFYVIDANTYETVLKNSAAMKRVKSGAMFCHSLLFNNNEPCNHSNHYCPLPDVKKNKQLVTYERQYVDLHGKTVYAEINAFPIFDSDDNVVQMIEYWTDITERKELENKLKENLEARNKELTTKAMHMANDREILVDIIKEVQNLYSISHDDNKKRIKNILTKLNYQISSGHEWDEFELWFQEVHQNFFKILTENYPELTSREMKICAFLKLNLNTKDIASLTNLAVKTIEVYRTQLRKKLKLAPGENLYKFISQLS
ncbi:MAG: two-component regulator propeller domain-containing protein [Fidelibacterota bacterium]